MKNYVEDKNIIEQILNLKEGLGDELIILTHHYQRNEIVDIGHFRGDSFELSRKAAADKNARFIVFCGVHFMAESADILSQPHQTVQIPEKGAGCPMADMADIANVESAWEDVTSIVGMGTITPIVYMNSDANIKAFCGRNGGVVCTSSNAHTAFHWGFDQREKIFFFPDQHLGQNTGIQMGLQPEEMIVWDPKKRLGGNTQENIEKAKVFLWDGYCHVHTRFRVEHVLKMREKYPDAKIVVHPECSNEVVELADATGSTSFIVKYVDNAPSGSTIIIGTEINLINRLSIENPDKTVLELCYSLCPNMFKINLRNLLWTLENIGNSNVINVPKEIKSEAKMALDRMLALAP
ncbi:MAG: quinolinate synthase NadA [Desulfobacterales bacterium]|nr:MAG: quinolinate synthase NadA [Desulfobacterales bacterium]